ncbi:SAM hydrolase/SAM-dependent halogenase family protein [Algoriphagus namhaensis]
MALVTILSDYGDNDYYLPAVKASMLAINPQLNIIDISNRVNPFDLAQAAFLLRSTFRQFPKGTVHLVAINTTGGLADGYIGVKLEEHIFIGPNNGILSLLADQEPGIMVKFADLHVSETTFPAKDILAPIAAKVASGAAIHDFGGPLKGFKKLISRQSKVTKEQILGHVIHIDSYGNLITNIRKVDFDTLNPGKYTLEFSREQLDRLHKGYDQVEPGDCFAFFNSLGLLEIGINHGDGAGLLGLKMDSVVYINFHP